MYFEAIFQPSDKRRYNTEAKKLIGKRIAVQDGWTVQDGPYQGQQCFYVPKSDFGWIPKCDLQELKPVSFTRMKEFLAVMGFVS